MTTTGTKMQMVDPQVDYLSPRHDLLVRVVEENSRLYAMADEPENRWRATHIHEVRVRMLEQATRSGVL